MDERFYLHMEEIDLCWRLQRHGYRVQVEPASVVYHIGGASLPQGDARKVYYNFRNSLLMLYKNLPPSVWRRLSAGRVALDGLAALRALSLGRFDEAAAIRRAYRDARRILPSYRAERPAETDPLVLPPYRRSIVLDYFLHGRRRFSDLPRDAFR
jgi:GT2 family glycosyltransferase